MEWFKDLIFADQTPRCEACHGLVKPSIVFFGEVRRHRGGKQEGSRDGNKVPARQVTGRRMLFSNRYTSTATPPPWLGVSTTL